MRWIVVGWQHESQNNTKWWLWCGKLNSPWINECTPYFSSATNKVNEQGFLRAYLGESRWEPMFRDLTRLITMKYPLLMPRFVYCWITQVEIKSISNEIVASLNVESWPRERLRWVTWLRGESSCNGENKHELGGFSIIVNPLSLNRIVVSFIHNSK